MSCIKSYNITKVEGKTITLLDDSLSVEEPLAIKIEYGSGHNRATKDLSITMRTPGNDELLAIGFLFTEGIINSFDDIEKIAPCDNFHSKVKGFSNSIKVSLKSTIDFDIQQLERHFYTTSSCGVCGKASIELLDKKIRFKDSYKKHTIRLSELYQIPDLLFNSQQNFSQTGGIHAAALINKDNKVIFLREDVGRHNALDKLIGEAIQYLDLPLNNQILVLSGRISFELIQKALMAGITFVVAMGAPSSIAVELAQKYNLTLVGFLKENKCNIYTGIERVII